MEEKVKVTIELDKDIIRSALLLMGISGKDPKMAAELLEKVSGEIIVNDKLLGEESEINQIRFVFAVAAIGTVADELDKKEKSEKQDV